MRKAASKTETIDSYIAGFPPDVQKHLKKIRSLIRKAAPAAEETIKYRIPTYVLNGNLIYFAAFKNHISIFPRTKGMDAFKKEIASYEAGRGTLRFPLDEPIPFDLIARLAAMRVKEGASAPVPKLKKAAAKTPKKSTQPRAAKRTKLPAR
jgi:uncharacterized protein YdhG (YjbR/CyaY superfamily)